MLIKAKFHFCDNITTSLPFYHLDGNILESYHQVITSEIEQVSDISPDIIKIIHNYLCINPQLTSQLKQYIQHKQWKQLKFTFPGMQKQLDQYKEDGYDPKSIHLKIKIPE